MMGRYLTWTNNGLSRRSIRAASSLMVFSVGTLTLGIFFIEVIKIDTIFVSIKLIVMNIDFILNYPKIYILSRIK